MLEIKKIFGLFSTNNFWLYFFNENLKNKANIEKLVTIEFPPKLKKGNGKQIVGNSPRDTSIFKNTYPIKNKRLLNRIKLWIFFKIDNRIFNPKVKHKKIKLIKNKHPQKPTSSAKTEKRKWIYWIGK